MNSRTLHTIIATCIAALLCTFALGACSPAADTGSNVSTGGNGSDRPSAEPSQSGRSGSATTDDPDGTDTYDNDQSDTLEGDSVESKYVAGVVLVTFAPSTSVEEAQAALATWGARASDELCASDLESSVPVSVTLPSDMSVEQGIAAAKQLSCVAAVQPNYVYHLM